MKSGQSHVHNCPACGSVVWRVRRRLGDRLASLFGPVHRYRCQNIDCGWEGTEMPSRPATSIAGRFGRWRPGAAKWAIGGLVILAGFAFIRFNVNPPAPPVRPQACDIAATKRYVPAGESFDGFSVPRQAPASPLGEALTLRSGCAWGVPGRSPYMGSVRQALEAARLPADVVHKIDAKVAQRAISGRVEISRDAIRTMDGRRQFETKIAAMGFGQTMCFATQVNFAEGHVEFADLYDATDSTGRRFAVMVPYVCGNVSVLAERAERPEAAGVPGSAAGPAAVPGVPGTRRGMAAGFGAGSLGGGVPTPYSGGGGGVWVGPEDQSGGGSGGGGTCEPGNGGTQSVPEPATMAMVLAGLVVMMVVARRPAVRTRRDGRASG